MICGKPRPEPVTSTVSTVIRTISAGWPMLAGELTSNGDLGAPLL
jgi:hypothetical protein